MLKKCVYVLKVQLFGCPKVNFGLITRQQPHLLNINYCTLFFALKVTKSYSSYFSECYSNLNIEHTTEMVPKQTGKLV